MKTADEIIKKAVKDFEPIHALLLFSGGHDSVVSTHISMSILDQLGLPYSVYHGNTTISIKETREYVVERCIEYNLNLFIGSPKKGETYKDIVREYGFPGPNKKAHQIMYRRLKERALRNHVTHVIKSKPHARENVLLISGARQSESSIRMGYSDSIKKENSRIWCAPCFYWQSHQIDKYMKEYQIKRNPVKDTIGISGECLCGCFADKGEFDKIAQHYPDAGDYLDQLHTVAIENGKPWPWTHGPTKWSQLHPEGQIELELGMCSSCSRIK